MLDDQGYEWGLELTRTRAGLELVEYHRHYNEASARVALREEQRRIDQITGGHPAVRVTSVRLARRHVDPWEVVEDD